MLALELELGEEAETEITPLPKEPDPEPAGRSDGGAKRAAGMREPLEDGGFLLPARVLPGPPGYQAIP